ncbi:MAG: hypothetical protein HKN23_20865 [Verrucomicrobiales bacterium]|nr:hypothetical protein [Verrucomicrobiales bacterium]
MRAALSPDGSVVIERLDFTAPSQPQVADSIPVQAEEISSEPQTAAQPETSTWENPGNPSEPEVAHGLPSQSPWQQQQQPPQQEAEQLTAPSFGANPAQGTASQGEPAGGLNEPAVQQHQQPAAQPMQQAQPVPGSLFQTDSATPDQPHNPAELNQEAAPNPAAIPNTPGNPLPWANPGAQAAAPTDPANSANSANSADPQIQNFSTPSPFESQAAPQEEQSESGDTALQPQQEEIANPTAPGQPGAAPAPDKKKSGKSLGKSKRPLNLGWLKWMIVLALLGGGAYAGYIFAPDEKVQQFKVWLTDFIKPATDVLGGNGGESPPDPPPANPNPENSTIPIPNATGGSQPVPALPPPFRDEEFPVPLPGREIPTTPPASGESPAAQSPDSLDTLTPALAAGDSISETDRINKGGADAITQFYSATEAEARLPFLYEEDGVETSFREFCGSLETLPTLAEFRPLGTMKDAGSGKTFGVFDVTEKENEALHRWIVVEIEPNVFKLDWTLYKQLAEDALPRFLTDTTAPTREFRLMIRKGGNVSIRHNPWFEAATELYLQSPFDSQPPRTVIIKNSDFEGLGFSEHLVGDRGRIARVELSWVPSEYNPQSRVPVVSRLIGWGAWQAGTNP